MGRVDSSNIPQHVALIMDGNRRWARKRGFFPLKGHLAGEERIEPIVDRAIELGIGYLTFWAFSTENWKRTKREVGFLLNIFRDNLSKKVESFHRKNVKINVIGNVSMFPNDIQEKTKAWIEKTKHNSAITVNIALSYGGRDELLRAIVTLAGEIRNSKFEIRNLTEQSFAQFLDTAGQPDPDLLIRTGGEFRLSGFMLWQIAYTELYFTDTYWPDFTPKEFDKAIAEYQSRQRRFGR
ncbi:di-trans,poly-cis-decaprenylcistransferase [Patescibacteria group bacterium]|nr:di-trans,poly-cis-decaprenylcistransferase [Patescibacteria group bacterium]